MNLKALAQKLRSIFGRNTVTGFEQFEFDTAGADTQRDTFVPPPPRVDFVDGWWLHARRFDIHSGRIGGAISPWSTVVHTTDMVAGTMVGLLKRWRAAAGVGSGAHFLIGRAPFGMDDAVPSGGLVQLTPINRNANHAGGPTHGWFKTAVGRLIHPNSVTIGIEVDNAGRLVKKGGLWVHKDSGKVFLPSDVHVDARGRGYEKLTAYQRGALELLLDTLHTTMLFPPVGVEVVPNGTYKANGVPEAELPGVREVGHWTLDPTRKTDPGSEVTEWLRARDR